ncbi:MAG: chemotaxis protein CheX [Syntrophobacterales bacterium]|nr:chemotaxis protein CheX [Syntrophobacterales bacterium]
MRWAELMKEAISNTLEKMFYTLVEFDGSDEESNWKDKKRVVSHIKLTGQDSMLVITVDLLEAVAFQIAADFMGVVVEKVKQEDMEDCLKELANMIGGYCVSSSKGKYSLGLPQIGYPSETMIGSFCWTIPLFILGEKCGEVTICSKD